MLRKCLPVLQSNRSFQICFVAHILCCVSRTSQLVIEDLRYVDTAVVLAFVKARADSVIRDPNHFSAHLG
jgi:hypothetical protein